MANKALRVLRSLNKSGIQGVECSLWRDSVRLVGEVDDYDTVIRAGKIAARFGFKGVINDIRVKGFIEPPTCMPKVADASLHNRVVDVVIIGGGVIGCAIARELTRYNLSIMLLEKEADVAVHTSSRNDGMVHPGVTTNPKTLRAKYNVRGNAMYTELTKELSIPFKRIGNLVMSESSLLMLPMEVYFRNRMARLKVEGTRLNKKQLYEREPNLKDGLVGAMLFPSSGILSPYKLTVALAENAVENGAEISLETVALGMEMQGGTITGVITNRGTLRPRAVVNAAGVFADKVAEMANDRFFSIHPRKGELVILDKKKGNMLHTSMALVTAELRKSDTKGGGIMPTIDGNVLVGPDAYEQPYREEYSTNADHVDAILKKHLPLIKGLSPQDVITYFSGIRAATYEEDFIIEKSQYVKNLVHAAGIQSPGLASAPAIAEDVVKILTEYLKSEMEVKPNAAFNPIRKTRPELKYMTFEQKQAIIKENPDYGVIVCRCEEVSRGEIIDAMNSPIPALTLDAIKRRVRAGMGRCQGSFCAPLVTKLIAKHEGSSPDDVQKSGGNSQVLIEITRKGENAPC
ncbi:MAG TPA: NAD(P)/FAD-dependent oxidoreductase [Clostridia bacterium]|nr:NAD(P)/FAD-dependent oxidoreductase [Clostridia bacterium]